MQNIVFPDYNCSIMNTISTILNHYGIKSNYETVEELKMMLNSPYQNIVFMIFDGMGTDMLNQNLQPTDFINQHIKKELTSLSYNTWFS